MEYNKSIDPIEMPERMRHLPISPTGFPVPFFVTWFKDGKPCATREGTPDFRVVNPAVLVKAVQKNLCWVCGEPLGVFKCFVIGPMCAVNRVISEPPNHLECAIFAAKNCPFLANPRMVRNKKGIFEGDELVEGFVPAAGVHITRNPGAVCVWVTKTYYPFRPPGGGILFSIGDPIQTLWFAEGRPAKRDEVLTSIESGFPLLVENAKEQGPKAVKRLERQRAAVVPLLPLN
jgi:hypothetical protein